MDVYVIYMIHNIENVFLIGIYVFVKVYQNIVNVNKMNIFVYVNKIKNNKNKI